MLQSKINIFTLVVALQFFMIICFVYADDNNEKSTSNNLVSDTAITAEIKSKFLADPDIKSIDVHVETINGKVTLSGIVPNNEIKEKLESIASNINGVKRVVSNLDRADKSNTIKEGISDAAITTSIKSKLLADSEIKSLSIHVETINGRVTLTGKVTNNEIREKVESIANDTNGVKTVISNLDVIS